MTDELSSCHIDVTNGDKTYPTVQALSMKICILLLALIMHLGHFCQILSSYYNGAWSRKYATHFTMKTTSKIVPKIWNRDKKYWRFALAHLFLPGIAWNLDQFLFFSSQSHYTALENVWICFYIFQTLIRIHCHTIERARRCDMVRRYISLIIRLIYGGVNSSVD